MRTLRTILVAALLPLASLAAAQDSGGFVPNQATDVVLGDVAADLIASHAQEGFESGHELSLEQPDAPVRLHAQPTLLELALRNLIENALRHTPPGTQVVVEVWQTAVDAGVSVSDDGQRADAPRAPDGPATPGLGLGLRLVERIAEQLGATLQRDTGEGPMTTRFTLRWTRPAP